jgi:pyruvate,water dikinase
MPDELVASRALIRRVRGRAALDAARLTGAMGAIPGADERIRETYFGVERSVADVVGTPRRRFASTVHAVRSSAARRRASFSADVVIRAAVEIAAGAEEIVRWPTSRLLAYHVALVDLAARGMAAELAVAADAGAIHAGLQSVLAHHLPQAAARHHAIAVTLPTVFATPAPSASAAVFAGPTWAAIGLDTAPAVTPMAADRDRPLDELMKELEASPGWPKSGWRHWLRRRRVERLATEASRQLDRRERAKGAILLLGGEVRRIHLELGRRMVEMNGLTSAEDIDLLSLDEIRRALAGRATVAAATVERRRRWLDRHAAEGPIPVRFTGIPGPIDDTAVPAADRLVGWATSGGRFIGRARRVDGPDGSIRRDEVLVATTTDPSWSPLLMSCGAMVIERGGPLSHAAILAREFAVPAVFNVPGAAAFLDGRQVLVDGDAGVVTVLNHREAP